jgi:hypothetical protein
VEKICCILIWRLSFAAMYLLCKFSLASAGSTTHQVITSHNTIIFVAVNVLKTCIFAENNQHIKTLINMRCVNQNTTYFLHLVIEFVIDLFFFSCRHTWIDNHISMFSSLNRPLSCTDTQLLAYKRSLEIYIFVYFYWIWYIAIQGFFIVA